MPRKWKAKVGGKKRKKYEKRAIQKAINAIKRGMSIRNAEKKIHISKSVLDRHMQTPSIQLKGLMALNGEVEEHLVKRLITCGEWGYPMDTFDLRLIVKSYLDKQGLQINKFKNNMPGKDWARSFLKQHKSKLAERMCQNIKRNRAAVSPSIIEKYFENLSDTIKDIPPSHILNYDETNLTDDPGRKKVIMKRGTKYPERIMNSTKSATFMMYAGCADGHLLPPYIVYKATNMYNTWTIGGPTGARYNRSPSGWFDMISFQDWFVKVALPYLKKLPGKK